MHGDIHEWVSTNQNNIQRLLVRMKSEIRENLKEKEFTCMREKVAKRLLKSKRLAPIVCTSRYIKYYNASKVIKQHGLIICFCLQRKKDFILNIERHIKWKLNKKLSCNWRLAMNFNLKSIPFDITFFCNCKIFFNFFFQFIILNW